MRFQPEHPTENCTSLEKRSRFLEFFNHSFSQRNSIDLSRACWVLLIAICVSGFCFVICSASGFVTNAHGAPVSGLFSRVHGNKAIVHLKAARRSVEAGECESAVFHWFRYLRLAGRNKHSQGIWRRIHLCLKEMGLERPVRESTKELTNTGDVHLPVSGKVVIPGGYFFAGANDEQKKWAFKMCLERWSGDKVFCSKSFREKRLRKVYVHTFEIDRAEVTGAGWNKCVAAGKCKKKDNARKNPTLPVVGVTIEEAAYFCRFAGGRLPSEVEWEKAARGNKSPVSIWPWGRVMTGGCAALKEPAKAIGDDGDKSSSRSFPWPPGSFSCDVSPYGLVDMGGNVREWTVESKSRRAGKGKKKDGKKSIVKGGSFRTTLFSARISRRSHYSRGYSADDIGFRCVSP